MASGLDRPFLDGSDSKRRDLSKNNPLKYNGFGQ